MTSALVHPTEKGFRTLRKVISLKHTEAFKFSWLVNPWRFLSTNTLLFTSWVARIMAISINWHGQFQSTCAAILSFVNFFNCSLQYRSIVLIFQQLTQSSSHVKESIFWMLLLRLTKSIFTCQTIWNESGKSWKFRFCVSLPCWYSKLFIVIYKSSEHMLT